MKLNATVGIAGGIVAAVALFVVLFVAVKPSAREAAQAWNKAEGAKLVQTKRDVEQKFAQENLLWEAAVAAKKAGPDSAAVVAAVKPLLVPDETGFPKMTSEGAKTKVGWENRSIVLEFKGGKLVNVDVAALVGAN